MSLINDARGAMSAKAAVGLVVALMVFGLLAAVTLPVAINAIEGDATTTLTQDVGTEYEVNPQLNSTVTAVTDATDATIELNDTRTSGTTSNTITVGATQDYDLEGGTVTVGVESASSGSPGNAVANYSYARDYAYSGAASSIWAVFGLAIVLAAFLFAMSVALQATNRI